MDWGLNMNLQKLKHRIREYHLETNIPYNRIQKMLAMERLILKISHSRLSNHMILKGGYLLSLEYGYHNRHTKDIDFTLSAYHFDSFIEDFIEIVEENKNKNTEEKFVVSKVKNTREDFDYPGVNIKIQYFPDRSQTRPLAVIECDITTGENDLFIAQSNLELVLLNQNIEVIRYEIEQILSDKLYTTLAYGQIDDKNTRSKDLYDIYELTKNEEVDYHKIFQSMQVTIQQRESTLKRDSYLSILNSLSNSQFQREQWEKFTLENEFAKGISFDKAMDTVYELANKVEKYGRGQYNKNKYS
jgi:hypothetical protein